MKPRTTTWKNLLLGDLLTLKYGKGLPERQRTGGSYPVIGSGGIIGYHNEPLVKGPGIIIGRKGSIGTVHFEKRDFFPIDTVFYVELKESNCDIKFIYYLLLQSNLNTLNSDAAVPGLNRDVAHRQPCRVPSLPIQRKIAAILSAYDDLTENNMRRITILEETAQMLYREWFVKFRFPGHEKVKMVDSPMGPIPEEWEVKKLGEVCLIVMGQSPKSEFYNETGEGLPFHQGVTDFGQRFPTDRIYCTVQNRIAEAGDILFSVRAPVGRINIANNKIVIGRGLCAIRSKTGNQAFVFQQLKEMFQEEDLMGGGTIFKSVTKDDMYRIEFLLPTEPLIAMFEHIVNPMFSEMANLTAKNANLRRTRDLLLSKLISGEVNVEEINIDTERGTDR